MSLVIIFLGLSLLLYLIVFKRWNVFVAMLLISIILGLFLGVAPSQIIPDIEQGIGSAMGSLCLVLAFGAMISHLMESSQATTIITNKLITTFGVKWCQIAIVFVSIIISFALFFDTAFILLVPIILNISKQLKVPNLYIGLPSSLSLLTIHALFPPHPGSMTIINTIHPSLLSLFLLGLFIAIPCILIVSIGYTNMIYKHEIPINNSIINMETKNKIPFSICIISMLLPIVLIILGSISQYIIPKGFILSIVQLIGNPVTALFIDFGFVFYFLGIKQNNNFSFLMNEMGESFKTIALVLLINGAGGGLKSILMASHASDTLVSIIQQLHLSPIIASFCISMLLRVMLGSTTISAMTAASIVKPLLIHTSVSPVLITLSIGFGSMSFSHVNDPGFWLVKEYFKVDVRTTLKTWTIATGLIGILGMFITFIFSIVI